MEERDWVEQVYSKTLRVNSDNIDKGDRDIHDYILRGLANLDTSELDYLFGVRQPSRLLSEGETIHGGITIEDFAITGSYHGGEMAIGQVASCNGKELVGSVPRDYRQVNRFGETIKSNPDIDPDITGYFLVRTVYSPEEVRKRNKYFDRDVGFFGSSDIDVEILRIEPEENTLDEAMRSFYSSLTQS